MAKPVGVTKSPAIMAIERLLAKRPSRPAMGTDAHYQVSALNYVKELLEKEGE